MCIAEKRKFLNVRACLKKFEKASAFEAFYGYATEPAGSYM